MYPQEIHGFLLRFFKENGCEIIEGNNNYMAVQLTIEMDKRIMNRPFYWRYIESVNGESAPATLTFITDPNEVAPTVKGEVVYLGSPRLSQLFSVTNEMGRFVHLYEQVVGAQRGQSICTPWLGVNYKIAYRSHQTKEMLFSLGMNLMTGAVIEEFQKTLSTLKLSADMSTNTFHLPYTISPQRALDRLEAIIENVIAADDHSWALVAEKRWQKDQLLLDYFYEGEALLPPSYEIEKKALEEQYKPRVEIEIISGGLFYLQ